MIEFDTKAFNAAMEKLDKELPDELPEVKRFHAAALVVGGDMKGDNFWIVMAVTLLGVNEGWEWPYLLEHTVKILPIYVKGSGSNKNRGMRFTEFWIDTNWDFSYPISIFAEVFRPIAIAHKKCWSLPATVERAKEIWEQEYASWEKALHTRVNKNGDRFVDRTYHMMKEMGSTKKHVMKGRAIGKSTAMQCPVCKQTKDLDPTNPWHLGKSMCCPDCKPFMAGPRGIRSDVPHMDPADDLRPAVNAMVQGQEVDRMIAAGVDPATPNSEVTAMIAYQTKGPYASHLDFVHMREHLQQKIFAALHVPAEMLGVVGSEPEKVSVAESLEKTKDIPIFSTMTGRMQCKEPNISNLPRSEKMDDGQRASDQILICEGQEFLVDGDCVIVWDRNGFRKKQGSQFVHGKFVQDDTHDGHMFLRRGSPVRLIDSDGKEIGRAVIRGDGELDVLEEALDIKLGKSFWAVVGIDRDDPSVCHGKVMAFYYKYHEDSAYTHNVIHLRLDNGHVAHCSDKELFRTQEKAEAQRMKLLEGSNDDGTD